MATQARTRHNLLRTLSSLVGRTEDLATLAELVRANRLVTLLGAPGCGKTRLAHELGLRLLDDFPDGIFLVDLVPVRDEARIDEAVTHSLLIHEAGAESARASIVEYLRERRVLLILDNCEHLTAAVNALAADLLQRCCPDMRIVATSRQRLQLPGESVWPVVPLSIPPLSSAPADLDGSRAVELWLDRVRSLQPGFEITPDNCLAVAELVRRLDGIPLALELAAGWSNVFSPGEILERLEPGGALTSRYSSEDGRHLNVHSAIAWSYERLAPVERDVFTRLGIFAAGCRLPAMAAVCEVEEGALAEVVAGLIDKSLLGTRASHGETKYGMLTIIRQFALGKLRESGELSATESRFVDYYAELAGPPEFRVGFEAHARPVRTLDIEFPNVGRALGIALVNDPERASRMAAALCRYWDYRGRYDEAIHWLERVIRHSRCDPAAKALCMGWLSIISLRRSSDTGTSVRMVASALALAREIGTPRLVASCLQQQALVCSMTGDPVTARQAARDALDIAVAIDDPSLTAHCRYWLGCSLLGVGELEAARACLLASVADARELDCRHLETLSFIGLGQIELACGGLDEAAACLKASLRIYESLNPNQLVALFETFAAVEARRRDMDHAAALLGAADRLRADFSLHEAWTDVGRHHRGDLEPIRDSPRGRRALAVARRTDLPELVRQALEGAAASEPVADVRLTAREVEVAQLVAQGLTNRQIAMRLSISERTAEGHVERIRKKLAAHARREIADWVAAGGPHGR
ncbi:MAG TPA: LuxR C-terminal-related transcriptional regulator [Candidatus Dormibacteraeota bacterium]